MDNLEDRLAEHPKEELLLVLHTLASADATTRDRATNVLDYIDGQHRSRAAKRRSSRPSTRASSDTSQEAAVQIHPNLQEALKIGDRDIKICKVCNKAFEQRNNTSSSCSYHDGHWLIEVEDDDAIEFVRASEAPDLIKNNDSLMWVMSCCSNTKETLGQGCVPCCHIAMSKAATDETAGPVAAGSSKSSKKSKKSK